MKVVFTCPSCRMREEWPKTLTGELVKNWHCSTCGAGGELSADILEKLMGLIFDGNRGSGNVVID
jgi:hypothetical protein